MYRYTLLISFLQRERLGFIITSSALCLGEGGVLSDQLSRLYCHNQTFSGLHIREVAKILCYLQGDAHLLGGLAWPQDSSPDHPLLLHHGLSLVGSAMVVIIVLIIIILMTLWKCHNTELY